MKSDEAGKLVKKGRNPYFHWVSGHFRVVRGAGLEPAHPCGRQDLNLVRLPISPPARRKQKRESSALDLWTPALNRSILILACIGRRSAAARHEEGIKPKPVVRVSPGTMQRT